MIKELEALELERQQVYKEQQKYVKMAIPFIAGAVILIVIGVILHTQMSGIGMVFFLLGALLVIVSIVINSIGFSKSTPFKKTFKKKVIETMLKNKYDNVDYRPDQSLPLNQILSTGLVKRPDRWRGEDYIAAQFKGVDITVSEFKLEDRRTRTDSKGRTTTYYETYFLGRWFIFKFHRNFEHQLRIIEKNFFGFSFSPKGFSKVETESIGFNKKFLVETTDKHHAFYIITPSMIEKIGTVEQAFSGSISMLWRGNELHIAVNDNKNALEPKISQPLNDAGIKMYSRETDVMGDIIEYFGLNRSKFTKED